MDCLLSIVVPAYNMEKHLRKCLDSICIEEIMDRVEIIIVNDGSRDGTLAIAREYEHNYPGYFIVIDKENGNYGSCMNQGLAVARGKYFRTLDADDWYDYNAFKAFVHGLESTDADMLICERGIYYEGKNGLFYDSFPERVINDKDIVLEDISWHDNSLIHFLNVNCITYKTNLLKQIGMEWTESVFYSDTEYDYFPLSAVKTIRFMALPVYCYYVGRDDQSMSDSSIRKNFNSFYLVSKRILEDFLKNAYQDSPQYAIQKHHLVRVLRFLYQSLLYDGEKHSKEINTIESLVKLCSDIEKTTAEMDVYRGYHYISLYRYNRTKFYLLRLDYLIRTNQLIKKLIGNRSS